MENSKNTPNWFEGNIYENGGAVIIESSGEEFELNNLELSIYDFLCGTHVVLMDNHFIDFEIDFEIYLNGIEWFKQNNHKAYMKLLHEKDNDIKNLMKSRKSTH